MMIVREFDQITGGNSGVTRLEMVACEAYRPMAELARWVLRENGMALRVNVLDGLSTELAAAFSDAPFDLVVSEILDSRLLGEGWREAMWDLHRRRVLSREAQIVPRRARLMVAAVTGLPEWLTTDQRGVEVQWRWLENARVVSEWACVELDVLQEEWPVECGLSLKLSHATVQAVVLVWRVDMGDHNGAACISTEITASQQERIHWKPVIYCLEESGNKPCDGELVVRLNLRDGDVRVMQVIPCLPQTVPRQWTCDALRALIGGSDGTLLPFAYAYAHVEMAQVQVCERSPLGRMLLSGGCSTVDGFHYSTYQQALDDTGAAAAHHYRWLQVCMDDLVFAREPTEWKVLGTFDGGGEGWRDVHAPVQIHNRQSTVIVVRVRYPPQTPIAGLRVDVLVVLNEKVGGSFSIGLRVVGGGGRAFDVEVVETP
jgi:hypothetical protein